LLCTNDFAGSWSPTEASHGRLPGGEGLKKTVERLQEGQPTIWADAGDVVHGGQLTPLTGSSVVDFDAVAALGIDVAAAGNHEFDYGAEHLREHTSRLGFPLLCANAEVGLPATAVIPTEVGDVGFVGITQPAPPKADAGRGLAIMTSEPDPAIDEAVADASRRLRKEGAAYVVALLHDGVSWSPDPLTGQRVDTAGLARLCGPWLSSVDAVVAGHTLARWIGHLGGTPVVQPAVYGAEIGVIELSRGGTRSRAYGVPVEPTGRWTGPGCETMEETRSKILGWLDEPLQAVAGGPSPLMDFVAGALRRAVGADAAVVAREGFVTQPPTDGVLAHLPAGPVTEADLLRLLLKPDDSTVRLEVTRAELEAIVAAASGVLWLTYGADVAGRVAAGKTLTLAMTRKSAASLAEGVVPGREREDTGIGLRDAVRGALGRGARTAKDLAGPGA
jgi:2',3'-cyclic-nucleotide 2'-phosphodiesterase (5'-nucleotidase family)